MFGRHGVFIHISHAHYLLIIERIKMVYGEIGKGKILEHGGKRLLWDWEYRMRMTCIARRPDLTLRDKEKNEIYIVDMACPSKNNRVNK